MKLLLFTDSRLQFSRCYEISLGMPPLRIPEIRDGHACSSLPPPRSQPGLSGRLFAATRVRPHFTKDHGYLRPGMLQAKVKSHTFTHELQGH